MAQEKGKMTVSEAGRKGGQTTSKKYGPEFYEKIGEKGGEREQKRVARQPLRWAVGHGGSCGIPSFANLCLPTPAGGKALPEVRVGVAAQAAMAVVRRANDEGVLGVGQAFGHALD